MCKKPFHQFCEELFSSRGKKNQTVFTKGKQTKALKKKKLSLFLKPELAKGQGGLRLTVPAPSLKKECGPESTGWPSRQKLAKPYGMFQSCDVCLLQPINTPNDTLNKSPYFEPCFLFSFHVVSPSERIKAMRLLFLRSIRQEFFEVNVFFCFFFFFSFSP